MIAVQVACLAAALASPPRATVVRTADAVEFRIPSGMTPRGACGGAGPCAAGGADGSAVVVATGQVSAEWNPDFAEMPPGVAPFETASGLRGFVASSPADGAHAATFAFLGGSGRIVTVQTVAATTVHAERIARAVVDTVRILDLPLLSGCYSWSEGLRTSSAGASARYQHRCFDPSGRLRMWKSRVGALLATGKAVVTREDEEDGRWTATREALVLSGADRHRRVERIEEADEGILLDDRLWVPDED